MRRAAATWRGLGWSLLALLLIAVTLVAAVAAALGTEAGSRRALAMLQQAVPTIAIGASRGNWLDGLDVERFSYADDGVEVTLTQIHLRLSWRALLIAQLRLRELQAATLLVRVEDDDSVDDDTGLTVVATPLPLLAPQVAIGSLTVDTGGAPLQLDNLRGAVSWFGTRLRFTDAAARLGDWRAQATGVIQFQGNYPLQLDGRIDSAPWQGQLTPVMVRSWGDLGHLGIELHSDGDWPLTVTGSLFLLDEGLPLQLVARQTRPLQWGSDPQSIGIKELVLTAQGNLDAIDGELTAAVTQPQFGDMPLQAAVGWRGDQLTFTPKLGIGDGALHGRCALTLAEPFPLLCEGALEQLALTPLGIDATLSTPFQLNLSEPATPALQLALPTLDGTLFGRPLRGALKLATADGTNWQIDELSLQSGNNALHASGRFGMEGRGKQGGALQLTLNAGALEQLEPTLRGALKLDATLRGPLDAPTLNATFDGRDLAFDGQTLQQLQGELQLAAGGRQPSQLRLSAGGLALAGLPPQQVSLRASGTLAKHQLQLDAAGDESVLRLHCDGRANPDRRDGELHCDDLRGQLPLGNRTLQWHADQPLALAWRAQPQRLRLAPFCLRAESSSLCLAQPLAVDGTAVAPFRIEGDNLPLRWAQPWLPRALRPGVDSHANLRLDVTASRPLQLTAMLELPASVWRLRTANGRRTLPLETARIDLRVDQKQAVLTGTAGITDLGALDLQATVTDPRGARTLEGAINIRALQLATVGGVIDGISVSSGSLDGRLDLGGTLASPALSGNLVVRDGAAVIEPLADPITELALEAWFDQRNALLQGRFRSGAGFGTVSGNLQWPNADEWAVQLTLEGSALRLAPLPDSEMTLNTRLRLEATPVATTLTGNIEVTQAGIRVNELPPETVAVSPDAVVVGREREPTLWDRTAIDLDLTLGQQFHFTGFGADTHLRGALNVLRQPGQALRAEGEVTLVDGRYRAYGQRLLVRRGLFLFTGPLDNPALDLEAIRELAPVVGYDDVEVGLRITGTLKDPLARIFSKPSMPESDAAYYLLTGRPPPEGTTGTEFSAGGTLLSLGLLGGEEQASRLAERFGISDLQISTSEGRDGTQAEVSGYLAERLYVRYGAGLNNQGNSITFQYQLTKRLVIEALSGLNDALDLIYTFEIE